MGTGPCPYNVRVALPRNVSCPCTTVDPGSTVTGGAPLDELTDALDSADSLDDRFVTAADGVDVDDLDCVTHTATNVPSTSVVAMSTATRRHGGAGAACFGTDQS